MRPVHKSAAVLISGFILALVFLAPPVTHGDEWNLMTQFTVNQPFQIPGMTLQPNTRYVIRLYDSPATRNVVQILNDDQTELLTMFMAVSDQRLEPAGNTVFTFIETEPGYALPIKEWFYPGRLTGLEFIYPKDQAIEIARHAREPILAAETINLHDLSSVRVEAIRPLGGAPAATAAAETVTKAEMPAVTEAKPTPAPEPVPSPPAVEEEQPQPSEAPAIAENVQPEVQREQPAEQPAPAPAAPAAPAPTEETTGRELPRTAGELPLIALIGALCLGAGLGLKVLSAKS